MKYENEVEDKIRHLIVVIEQKTNHINDLMTLQYNIKEDIEKLQKDLSIILNDIDIEEKKLAIHAKQSDTIQEFRLSILQMNNELQHHEGSNNNSITSNLFSSSNYNGIITQEHMNDSHLALQNAIHTQKDLYHMISNIEERNLSHIKKMKNILKSEDNKALERLKKRVIELESTLTTNQNRFNVLSTLYDKIKIGTYMI